MANDRTDRPLPREHYALVRQVLEAFPDGAPDGHVLVAVSCGSDSMALLELLALARRHARFAMSAAHVDHRLRPEATREATLASAAASLHGVAFTKLQLDDTAASRASSEAYLREQRYDLLEKLAAQTGASWIATGHTHDDQIETVLFRLLRGSGRKGLAAIPRRRGTIIRPLLGIRRDRLRRFLQERGIAWVDDPSNRSRRYARNRIRHGIIPTIQRELGRSGLDRLPLLAERWAAEEDYLASQAAYFGGFVIKERESGPAVDLVALERAPLAMRARVLRNWLSRVGGGGAIGLAQLEALERLAASREGSALAEIAGVAIVREYGHLLVAGQATDAHEFVFDVAPGRSAAYAAPSGAWRITVDPQPHGPPREAHSPYRHEVDVEGARLGEGLLLRPLRDGDSIARGAQGMSNVRDIMVDLQVPHRIRGDWPALVSNERVLWVPGIAVARGVAAPETAARRVRFGWHRTQF